MSERTDLLTTRMVDVIDALPVPAGPGGLRPRTIAARQRVDPVAILVVVAVLLAVFAATPAGRAAVTESGRLIERIFGLGPWPAYYGALVTDAGGVQLERLMFWDGRDPGREVLVAPRTGWRGGWWSEDRSAIAFGAGPSIYLGDRSGALREVARVDPLWVMSLNWVGNDRLIGLAREQFDRSAPYLGVEWLIRVDLRRGEVTRTPLPEAAGPARGSGLLGSLDPGSVPPTRKFSPDGRWLSIADQPCRSVAVYDLDLGRRLDLADGVSTRGVALGWLRGSVLVWGVCDLDRGILRLRAGAPDAAPTEIGTVPLPGIERYEWAGPLVDDARDRILSPARDGDDWLIVGIDLGGQQTEVARLRVKIEADLGDVRPIAISRDGRLLAFVTLELVNTGYADTLQPAARAGVVDVTSGQITWACDVASPSSRRVPTGTATDCAKIRLR